MSSLPKVVLVAGSSPVGKSLVRAYLKEECKCVEVGDREVSAMRADGRSVFAITKANCFRSIVDELNLPLYEVVLIYVKEQSDERDPCAAVELPIFVLENTSLSEELRAQLDEVFSSSQPHVE